MPTFKDFFTTIKTVITDFGHYWRYFIQDFAIAALIPIGLYNPKKNKRIADPRLYLVWKYFFYVYYPLHITILCLIGKK
jgi:hypothetical protein